MSSYYDIKRIESIEKELKILQDAVQELYDIQNAPDNQDDYDDGEQ